MSHLFMLIIIIGFVFTESVFGMANPATVYCQDLGYEWTIEKTEKGDVGFCKFPDGTVVEEWDFLKGKEGEKWSYCGQKGYELKILYDSDECASIYSKDCAVCVLRDEIEIEASKLVKAEKEIPGCGNGICDPLKESFEKCPQDCLPLIVKPARSFYFWLLIIFGVIIGILIGGIIYFRLKKRRELY